MEKQDPPTYGEAGYSQSGPNFPPGAGYPSPEYVPPAQVQYPQQPYPVDHQAAGAPPTYPAGAPPTYPPGVQPVGVYTVQPPGATVIVRQSTGPMPNDYLMFAIFVTFCCCLPCGIVAIIKASETKNRWHAGDMEGAVRNSNEAKKWAMISLICGIITEVCVVGFIVIYYAFIFSIYL